jgi:retron-type reverse transcriptase
VLTAIYEQDFLECSYGYRPERGALDAVKEMTVDLQGAMATWWKPISKGSLIRHLDTLV